MIPPPAGRLGSSFGDSVNPSLTFPDAAEEPRGKSTEVSGHGLSNVQLPSRLELDGERHPARPAAWARGGDKHALLLLFVEIGAIQHGAHLLLKQVVQRCRTVGDRII